jgi:hypothetical protein
MVIIIIIKNKNNTKMKKMIDCPILVIELNLIKYPQLNNHLSFKKGMNNQLNKIKAKKIKNISY